MPTDLSQKSKISASKASTNQALASATQPSDTSPAVAPSANQSWALEIFRAGSFKSMQGCDLSFSDADLKAIAAGYDSKTCPAPLVIGHPKSDDPAFGWVSNLKEQSGRLIATIDQVSDELVSYVKDGRYRKISAAFFGPQSKANPRPGHYHLKHVGLLGAAAPAVPGLKLVGDAAFMAEGRDLSIELDLPAEIAAFSEIANATQPDLVRPNISGADTKTDRSKTEPKQTELSLKETCAALFHALNSFVFETYGAQAAERALPPDLLKALKSVQSATQNQQNQQNQQNRQDQMFAENLAALEERETALRTREDHAFIEDLVSQGKPLGGEIGMRALECLAQISSLERDHAFASDAHSDEESIRETLKALLADLPTQVPLGEIVKPHQQQHQLELASFATPPGCLVDPGGLETHSRILAWQESHPNLSYADAARQLADEGL